MTIQTKTSLLYTLLTAAILLPLSFSIYYFTSRFAFDDFLKRLEFRAVVSTRIHFEQNKTSANAYNELRMQYLEALPHEKEYILLFNPSTLEVSGNRPKDLPPNFYKTIVSLRGETAITEVKNVHYAGLLHDGKDIVIISAVNEYGANAINNLKKVLAITGFCALIVVLTISQFFSKSTFKPVRYIVARVKDISAHNLHLRLENDDGKDEISELSKTFNNMLDRLETAFETQNNFISNASHELRTPLTTIIGEAEIALSKARTTEEYRQALETITREAGKLQNLTGSLLSLAQSGFNGQKQEWSMIRIDELVFDMKQSLEERDPQNQVLIDLNELPDNEEQLMVEGNWHLLKLALSNVVINACKYSNNKPVRLALETKRRKISIVVSDEGIGIPEPELKNIYEPFFRASNSNRFEGYGIGLPLTKAIMKVHNGSINVLSQEGKGTNVTLEFPVAKNFSNTRYNS